MEFVEEILKRLGWKIDPVAAVCFCLALVIGIATLCLYATIRIKKRKKRRKSTYKKWFVLFQKFFSTVPILKNQYEKIRKSLKIIYPDDIGILNNKATSFMLSASTLVVAGILLVLLSSGGSVFYILAGICFVMVLFNEVIRLRITNIQYKLLLQLKDFISEVRHNYYISNKMIDDAIYLSIDSCKQEIKPHAEKIYDILISTEIEKEADSYISTAPNRFLMTFVAICTSVIQNNDVILENGQSILLNNLSILREELNVEKRRIETANFLFAGRSFISIFAIFFIRPIETWVTTYMPETKAAYEGAFGTIAMAAIFISSMVCYGLINNMKDIRGQEAKEHVLLEKIAKIRFFRALLTGQIEKNYTRYLRLYDDIKRVGEKISTEAYLLRKYLMGVAFILGSFLLILFANWQEKQNILTNFTDSFESSIMPDPNYQEIMRETAQRFAKQKEYFNAEMTEEKLIETIKNNSEIKKTSYAQMIAQVLIEKQKTYANVYFRWYLLIVIFGAGAIGYMLPDWLLKSKVKGNNILMDEEVNQFQTIVMMLMYTNGISIQVILEWMERFAFVFKDSVTECLSNIIADEEEALKHLRDSESFPQFKMFINNMLVINDQGIIAAFDEVVSERENSTKDREQFYLQKTQKRAKKANFICIAPFIFTIAIYLLLPMFTLGFNSMDEMNNVYSSEVNQLNMDK